MGFLAVMMMEPATVRPSGELISGGTITLEAVSYGTKHELHANPVHRLLQWLPKDLKRRLKITEPEVMTSKDPGLGIWIGLRNLFKDHPNLDYRILDESGIEIEASKLTSHWGRGTKAERQQGIVLRSFPRRSKSFLLRVYERDEKWKSQRVAEFKISNPTPGTYAEWKPEPDLTRKKDGNLEVQLISVSLVPEGRGRDVSVSEGDKIRAVAKFRVFESGEPSMDWQPDGVVMSDATGNELKQSSWSKDLEKETGIVSLSWGPTLWLSEKVWKLKFEFTRKQTAKFSPGEIWKISNLAVPGSNSVTQVNLVTNLNGHEIELIGMSSEDGKYRDYDGQHNSDGFMIDVRATPPLLDKQIDVIAVVDETGREATGSRRAWSRGSGTYGFGLKFHNQAKSLDITIAVHQSRYIEFVVEPKLTKKAESK